jgi:hypothetical protein
VVYAPTVALRSTELISTVPVPWGCSERVLGTSSRTTFTTPPSALLPYRSDMGPRTTSIRRAVTASMATAWSPELLERSPGRCPSSSTSTRSLERPRITGREVAGPMEVTATPGVFSSVSATVPAICRSRRAPETTVVGLSTSSPRRSPVVPVTTTGASSSTDAVRRTSTSVVRPSSTCTRTVAGA